MKFSRTFFLMHIYLRIRTHVYIYWCVLVVDFPRWCSFGWPAVRHLESPVTFQPFTLTMLFSYTSSALGSATCLLHQLPTHWQLISLHSAAFQVLVIGHCCITGDSLTDGFKCWVKPQPYMTAFSCFSNNLHPTHCHTPLQALLVYCHVEAHSYIFSI